MEFEEGDSFEDALDPRLERRWLEEVLRRDRERYRMQMDMLRTANPEQWVRTATAMQQWGPYDRMEHVNQELHAMLENLRVLLALHRKYGRVIAEARIQTIAQYFVEYGLELDAAIETERRERPARAVVDEFLRSLQPKGPLDPEKP